jgi:hypothetical protein
MMDTISDERHDPLFAALAGKLTARRSDCATVAGKLEECQLDLFGDRPSCVIAVPGPVAALQQPAGICAAGGLRP